VTDRRSVPPAPPASHVEATLALAHALRTPLTSLALGVGLLDDALGPLNEAQGEVVRALVRDVARLSLLVDRALQTDRLGAYAGPIERVSMDFGALVREASAPILEQARAKRVDVVESLPDGALIVADPVKLGWVVACVLGNALRYSPSGAVVEVRLDLAPTEAMLRIADQGPGILPDVLERIFDRTLGRGLYLAREIVDAHGGAIRVESKPDRGCEFTLTLPAARWPARAERGRDDQEG
jgi:signal transduction histidine kinase